MEGRRLRVRLAAQPQTCALAAESCLEAAKAEIGLDD
jgi:hypothetical protein